MKTFPNKKSLSQNLGLAILTKQVTANVAVLTFADNAINPSTSNRVQILPDGYFTPTDNRDIDVEGGKWLMDV